MLAGAGDLDSWPRTESGRLATDSKTFEKFESDAELSRIFAAKSHLLRMGRLRFPVGQDGRNRCHQAPFHTATGRSSPSNAESVYGGSKELRGLIKPGLGRAIVRADWKAQEGIIAAILSNDKNILRIYRDRDPYMRAAILAGAAPEGATKTSYPEIRPRFKAALLGSQYGLGVKALAVKTKLPLGQAEKFHRQLPSTFAAYWQWRDRIYTLAQLARRQRSILGWTMHWRSKIHVLSAQNWPVQALGSEMMRVAAINLYREGFFLVGLVHDAVLIECEAGEVDTVARRVREIMQLSSAMLLNGDAIDVDVAIVSYPDRYQDEGGAEMWTWLLEELEMAENNNEPELEEPSWRKKASAQLSLEEFINI
jgi:DNA polymerase-1